MQKKIDAMNYWDAEVLDFRIKYFGDEVELFLQDTDDKIFKVTFLYCYKVSYENDANVRWNNMHIKEMNKLQLGFYAHNIKIDQSGKEGFIEVHLDLPMLFVTIVCRNIEIISTCKDREIFFWTDK